MAIFFIPTHVAAVDFSITDVNIDAFLQDDGDVHVHETHTYEFNGEFGGIIRVLIPKERTEIVELEAFEDDKRLQIETDGFEHRIHRAGKDETINVDIFYTIKNGVDVYADVAEFFWAFFDKSNESTYENITINVFPPRATSDVIAFGYYEAFEKENIDSDGSVTYNLGLVRKNRNGDIRVAYEAALFPQATVTSNQEMREEILAENEQLINAAIVRAQRKKLLSTIGNVLLPTMIFIFLFLVGRKISRSKSRKEEIKRDIDDSNPIIPKQKLSLPTTIFFTNHHLSSESMAAALLDLVRKGYVRNDEEKRFYLLHRNGLLEHEAILVEWLFDEIGENGEFSFEDLATYTSNEDHHETYQSYQAKWEEAVKAEMDDANLYTKVDKFRLVTGLSCTIILAPFLILFPIFDLIVAFLVSLALVPAFVLIALISEKTLEGERIAYEWRTFREKFKNIGTEAWQALTDDEKMRAFIYGLGMNEKNMQKKNEELVKAFKVTSKSKQYKPSTVYSIDPTWLVIAAVAASNFESANTSASASSSDSSSTPGMGGGPSGAGGGSGGF